jgi:hypothetical protein
MSPRCGRKPTHFPTTSFGGNAAWLILNTIVHNLTRWVTASASAEAT